MSKIKYFFTPKIDIPIYMLGLFVWSFLLGGAINFSIGNIVIKIFIEMLMFIIIGPPIFFAYLLPSEIVALVYIFSLFYFYVMACVLSYSVRSLIKSKSTLYYIIFSVLFIIFLTALILFILMRYSP